MRTPVLKNVDVIAALEAVLKANTVSYQSDFYKFDISRLTTAARDISRTQKGKTSFMWMSRRCGTWCFEESDIYLKDSAAHNTWLYYYEQDAGEHPVALNVVLHGLNYDIPDKPGRVLGDIYVLNYGRTCENIKRVSIQADNCEIAYEKGVWKQPAGKRIYDELPDYGKFVSYRLLPNDELKFESLLSDLSRARRSSMETDLHGMGKFLGLKLD